MKRRLGTVAIVLMALTALAGVLSYIFSNSSSPKNSHSNQSETATHNSPSKNSPPSPTTSIPSAPTSSSQNSPVRNQPEVFKPTANDPTTGWKLLDWSVEPDPARPKVQIRASYYSAPGKFRFIRVEEQIEQDDSGTHKVLIRKEMVGDQIIVKLPTGTSQQKAEELAQKIGATAAAKPFAPDTWLFNLPPRLDAVPDGMTAAKATGPIVEYTEPNIIVHSLKTPNDPKFNDYTLWHLYNNSQLNKDINAPKAWDRRTSAAYGTNKVVVAVIDCGVRYTHEDLSANMWRNPGEIAGDGVDNDGDGWVDDVYGIDAYGTEDWNDVDFDAKKDNNGSERGYNDANGNGIWDVDSDPMPGTTSVDGHGTHCAGIIGAIGNNGVGSTGVAWGGVQLMALRFINTNSGSIADAILCIDYARARGAKVINASYGQNGTNITSEMQAIERARSNGVVFVAAAGNNNQSSDTTPFYPAAYTNRNIISVGATDQNDNKASFSNYGATNVDLMAPGVSIYSTEHGTDSSYGTGDGTSFAAPIVSGAVALLIAEYPTETVDQIVARVVNTNAVDVLPSLSGLCVTGGRLNLAKLLPAADVTTLPPAVAWHRPDYAEPLISSTMRTPTNIAYSNNVTIYSGVKKFNNTNGVNTNGLVNQTGGWLFYRTSAAVSWSSNQLAWQSNTNDYQFWKGSISNVPAQTYQYYLQLDFDSGARTTYSYSTNNADGFATTTNQATAQASPYTFSVPKAAATLTLSGTNQTYNGSARSVSVSTTPSGLSNTVTYNGSSSAPTNAGTYSVVATINDSNYQGSANATLTITKASATVTLTGLSQTYSGTARAVTATTSPSGLTTDITYDGSPSAPVNAGAYAVVANVNDTNYTGSSSGTLQVAKASATVSLSNLSQTYDGSPKAAAVSTSPSGLSCTVTYNGSATVPSAVGTYTVAATVSDANYQGSASGTLSITAPPGPTFASALGGATPTSDSDGDGVPALVEYALGGGTNSNDLNLLPIPSLAGSNISMTAVVRTNDTNLLIYPQAAFNLTSTNWTSSGFTTNLSNQTNVPTGFQRREYQYNAGTNPRAFLKLTVEQK